MIREYWEKLRERIESLRQSDTERYSRKFADVVILLFILLLIYAAFTIAPVYIHNYELEGAAREAPRGEGPTKCG